MAGPDGTTVVSAQIPANEQNSGSFDIGGHEYIAIELPDTFNATSFTVQSRPTRVDDNQAGEQIVDWDDVYDSAGNQIDITVAAGRVVSITGTDMEALRPLRYIRLVANVAINPGANIRLILK